MKRVCVLGLVLAMCVAAQAGPSITGVALGPFAPPATLGGYTMTAFPADGRPVIADVTSVASPLGGSLGFSIPLSHRTVGSGWATWSHGYTGDVYWTNGAYSVVMTLPDDTGAFYFYAEPNPFAIYTITATAQDGTLVSQEVDGSSGACGYGFYTDPMDIETITVASTVDFAIGEFGIAKNVVPAPAALLLGSIATGLVGWLRKRGTLA